MRKIKLLGFHRWVSLGAIIFIAGFLSSSSFAETQLSYGTFMPKIDIKNAANNYDPNSQTKLTSIDIDTNLPSTVYCGEEFKFLTQISGNYEDEKGNIYKRIIVNPEIVIEAPDFTLNKKEAYDDKYKYLFDLTAPTKEGKSQINIKAKYQNETIFKSFDIKAKNKSSWEEKQYIDLYGGSLGMFGIEASIASYYIEYLKENKIDMFINGSLYFRKKMSSDAYLMAMELGTKAFTGEILDGLYIFSGINIGFDTEGKNFESPNEGETKAYLGPNIGFKKLFWQCAIISQIEWIVYGDSNVALLKLGLGI